MPSIAGKKAKAPVETRGDARDLAQAAARGHIEVPDGPDDVTPEWLTEVLRRTGATDAVRVIGFNVEHLADGRGFLGQRIRLRLHVAGAADDTPATLVAKFAPADPKLRAHLARGGTARETRFYTDLADRAGLRTPRCYYAAMDEASGRSVLLLEDLTTLRPGDNLAGSGLDDAMLAVRHLARFHACWWEQPELAGLAWMPVLFDDPAGAQNVYRASWGAFLAAWGHLVPDRARAVGEWFESDGATVWEQIAAPPHTLMHGDFRLDNLLFDVAGAAEPLAVVDWQGVRRGKGVADLGYFAMSSLQPKDRRAWERQLVESYHAALVEHGVRGYDLARCVADYRLARLWNLHTLVVVGPLFDFSHPRAKALLVAAIERLVAVLDDDVQTLPPS